MKYIRQELKNEYRRLRKLHPNIDEFNSPLINISDVLRAYFILADYFSDASANDEVESMLIGIRDINLLISALSRQTICYDGRVKYREPLQICATTFFGLVKNHAFLDGNKRTALLTLLYQLDCYGYLPKADEREFEKLVVSVASNNLPKDYVKDYKHTVSKTESDKYIEVIRRLLKQMTKKKDNSFHIDITARDFFEAINNIPGCICEIDGIKIRMQRTIKKNILFFMAPDRVLTYTLPYRGDTRTIGASSVRDALKALELLDQYPDYQSFIEGADPRYMIITKFEGPLRRLKDK